MDWGDCYYSMITPLLRTPILGAIWYQGETDTTFLFTPNPAWKKTDERKFVVKLKQDPMSYASGKLRVECWHVHRRGLGFFLGEYEWGFVDIEGASGEKTYFKLKKKPNAKPGTSGHVQGKVGVKLSVVPFASI